MSSSVIGAALGAGLGLGVIAISAGWPRRTPFPAHPRQPVGVRRLTRRQRVHLLLALVAGLALWLVTGWAIAVVLAPLAVLGLPSLIVGSERDARQAIERLEATEEWVRQLASRLGAGIVVEQALVASAHTAPTALRSEVERLASRLRNGWSAHAALRRFADDLASPIGDLVVAELSLAATRRGAGVAQSLTQLADLVADEVAMHRQVDAERARPRLTARLVTLIAVLAAGFLALSGEYMQPYGSATGQLVLASIAAVFIAAVIWMRRMTATRPGPRFLHDTGERAH